jgi:hypothetical protein
VLFRSAPIITQNHSNLLPFWFVVEEGFTYGSTFNFTIETKNFHKNF